MAAHAIPLDMINAVFPASPGQGENIVLVQKSQQTASPAMVIPTKPGTSILGMTALTSVSTGTENAFWRDTGIYRRNMGSLSSCVVSEIDKLATGIEDEVLPSEFAYQNARSIVESAYARVESRLNIPGRIPNPVVTTDDVGGIRLGWRAGTKQVRVNFGAAAEKRSYLYFESPTEHSVENLDSVNLAERLTWLTAR